MECDITGLSSQIHQEALAAILSSSDLNREWLKRDCQSVFKNIPEGAGGVNAGDGRALYYLVRHLKSQRALEIGTHIGASTVHIAAALRKNCANARHAAPQLITVDIRDVNDETTKPWLAFGSKYSARQLVSMIGAHDSVKFVAADSCTYLAACTERVDFIFLDGNHAARTVYQEVAMGLQLLNEGGVIVLHDYFVRLRPLWRDRSFVPGPWLATERLRREVRALRVLPLGELPWNTKMKSRMTSLAVIFRAE